MRPLPAVLPVPRFFLESFRFFPLRRAGTGSLYIAFQDHIDHSVTLAIERITGYTAEAGLVNGSDSSASTGPVSEADFCQRASSKPEDELVAAGAHGLIERAKPVETRVVRMHDFYWLRLWKSRCVPAQTRLAMELKM